MNEIVETKASSTPTPEGTSDPDEGVAQANGEAENGEAADEKLAKVKERVHPFE
jgi:hypothetical protein